MVLLLLFEALGIPGPVLTQRQVPQPSLEILSEGLTPEAQAGFTFTKQLRM